jgi:phage/conjugal plasmid C-4 type zinc finger TraR family protein
MADLVDRAQARELELLEEARARHAAAVRLGPSRVECLDCGDKIPAERRRAVPGCRRCVDCETVNEKRARRA